MISSQKSTTDLSALRQLLAATALHHRYTEWHATMGSIERFLAHVARTVPFYIDLSLEQITSLSAFPVITRAQVRDSPHSFISQMYQGESLDCSSSSGTSGIPIRVYRDQLSLYVCNYAVFRTIFDLVPTLRGQHYPGECAVLAVSENKNRQDIVDVNPALGYAYMRQFVIYGDSTQDQDRLTKLRERRPALLYGRPHTLLALSSLAKRQRRSQATQVGPLVVLCSGDNLYDDVRGELERSFDAPVLNAYGSQETGLIAAECLLRNGLHVLGRHAHIEVAESAAPVSRECGEGELLVTSLTNWAMPIVRYRTGDFGSLRESTCGCGFTGQTITKLFGRDPIYFVVNGSRVCTAMLNDMFERLPIRQFRMSQKDAQLFEILVVPQKRDDFTMIRKRLLEETPAHLGNTVTVDVLLRESLGSFEQKHSRYSTVVEWR